MKKTKYKFTFQIYKHYITEWEEDTKLVGTFHNTATSEKKAINNICWREDFRNHYGADYTIKYTYKLLDCEEEKLIEEEQEPIREWPVDEDGDPLPLRKRENGIDYILTDNGEYTEVYD